MSDKFGVSIKESFAFGKIEGQKELLKELLDMFGDNTDILFVIAYLRARQSSLKTASEVIKLLEEK